jgi:hypothetical protein
MRALSKRDEHKNENPKQQRNARSIVGAVAAHQVEDQDW